MALTLVPRAIRDEMNESRLGALDFLRQEKKVPDVLPAHFIQFVTSGQFACSIEAHDPALLIQHGNQSTHRLKNPRDEIPLLLESPFCLFQIRDIKCNPMDE